MVWQKAVPGAQMVTLTNRISTMPGAMGPRLRRIALEIGAEELTQVGRPAALPAHGKDQPAGREVFAHHARGDLELMDLVSDGRSDGERTLERVPIARHRTGVSAKRRKGTRRHGEREDEQHHRLHDSSHAGSSRGSRT